ncbi:hypothetical protein WN51_08371 [Melipona quadrifasciata]|uniref:Uncharacterized protein n=1 Tax=Melipona quadrifasciata TaxID=166423 RepID=A0A0N1IU39_9HYME|nr:hypothetical protein WN51_08371 [Melipona quadrifasciata]
MDRKGRCVIHTCTVEARTASGNGKTVVEALSIESQSDNGAQFD